MTVTAAFCPFSASLLLDQNAMPIVGGTISFFDAGTTNPRAAYADAGLVTSLGSSVSTDGFARFPGMFIGEGAYKAVLNDANDVQLAVYDGLAGGVDNSQGTTPTGTIIPTGFVMPAHTNDVVDGWLPLNGETIGSATSGATSLADPSAQNLYLKLWNKDASLAVLGGRGVTASADWAANKTLALPDYRGRTFSGVDGMGTSLAGVLTALSSGTSANVVGAQVGSEGVQLTNAQNGPHSHNITVQAGGGVQPTGTTDTQGAHAHGGSTNAAGAHQHNYSVATGTTGANSSTNVYPFNSNSNAVTDVQGTHSHSIATDTQGAHYHNLAIAAIPAHTHTATSDTQGTGAAHSSVQPTVLGFWHIKL